MSISIGLALSGGGARGIAHIGVLQALMEHDIEIGVISGVSAGSIIGALHASGCSIEEMLNFANSNTFLNLVRPEINGPGLAHIDRLGKKLNRSIKVDRLEQLEKEMVIVATNLNEGKSEVFRKGPMIEIILASCSIPLIFRPIQIDHHLYVDGGLLMNMPVNPLVDQCDLIIGSSVVPSGYRSNEQLKSLSQIGYRCFELSIRKNSKDQYKRCDFVIECIGTRQFNIFQFGKTEELFELGYNAAIKKIEVIKERIDVLSESRTDE